MTSPDEHLQGKCSGMESLCYIQAQPLLEMTRSLLCSWSKCHSAPLLMAPADCLYINFWVYMKPRTETRNRLNMHVYTLLITLVAQDVNGQYVWSIMMGLVTLFMMMFVNVMLVAALLPGELAHVLILIPFVVPEMVQSLTTSPLTSPSFGYFPKLPTLELQWDRLVRFHTLVNLNELKEARHITERI